MADMTGRAKRWFVTVVAWLGSLSATAATLRQETIRAWNEYVQSVDAEFRNRLGSQAGPLWTLRDEKQVERLLQGEVVVTRVLPKGDRHVPEGLIHHWRGAIFIPGAELADVYAVSRDYDQYKIFYGPSVRDSKLVARTASEDDFSMVLMNKAVFVQSALEAEYSGRTVQVDARRFYSIASTRRVQEIRNFGSSGAERVPEGQGTGYIWRLHSIASFEERDGGVYTELEVAALSRDIPAAVRFVTEPIVRSIARNSLAISLEQTKQAVGAVAHVAGARPSARTGSGPFGKQLSFAAQH